MFCVGHNGRTQLRGTSSMWQHPITPTFTRCTSCCFLHFYDGDHTLSSNAINDGDSHVQAIPLLQFVTMDHVWIYSLKRFISAPNCIAPILARLNSIGTAFVNDHCVLRCDVAGNTLSMNRLNRRVAFVKQI